MRGDIIPPQRPQSSSSNRQPAREALNRVAPPSDVAPTKTPIDNHPLPIADEITSGQAASGTPTLSVRQRSGKRLVVSIATAGTAVLGLLLLLIGIWYGQQLTPVASDSTEKVKVVVERGDGLSDIASNLQQNGLIRNTLAFEWYVRQSGKTSLLQAGTYRLGKAEDVSAIVKHLTSGNTDSFSLTFLPGATLAKHRQVLVDAGYDEARVDVALAKTYTGPLFEGKPVSADLEGYIYGETYNFAGDATPEEILQHIFDYYAGVIQDNNLVDLYKKQGFSLYQGITMASIIQREVITAADAAQVAQVFKKRYDMGMQLGSDVTYQYIADKTGQARNVNLDSPYNTRRYAGLPPGPISTPGLAALKAVAQPAKGDYLYFLSGDDDKTYFARTNEEHEKNIRNHCQEKCQII